MVVLARMAPPPALGHGSLDLLVLGFWGALGSFSASEMGGIGLMWGVENNKPIKKDLITLIHSGSPTFYCCGWT
jgi:hypothetical protein